MKVASWNVNSIRSRHDRLIAWLEAAQPDVLCVQELKGTEDIFPFESIQAAGYHAAVYGQKTYNGVAIISRQKPKDIQRGLGKFEPKNGDPQARLIAATVDGVRIICVYVPNGQEPGSDKHAYKLQWLAGLAGYLEQNHKSSQRLVVCGDFNIAPADIDVSKPQSWIDSVLCDPAGREAVQKIRDWGLNDVFRSLNPDLKAFSWWDYRMLAFPKNHGCRIDYILATEPLAKKMPRNHNRPRPKKRPKTIRPRAGSGGFSIEWLLFPESNMTSEKTANYSPQTTYRSWSRQCVVGLYVLAALCGPLELIFPDNVGVYFLTTIMFALLATHWAVYDSKSRGKTIIPILQMLYFLLWPIGATIYLFIRYGWRGIVFAVLHAIGLSFCTAFTFSITYWLLCYMQLISE